MICLASICVVLSLFINVCLADIVFEKPNSSGMVDIIYDHDFPYKKSQYKKIIDGCYRFYKSTGKRVWRCREHMLMIRPITAIHDWLNLERKLGYFLFSVKEMGILNAHGQIKLIPSPWSRLNLPEKHSKNSSMVTGLSIRHTFDVGCYTFRVKKTGQISMMNVTPNHLFYVKNRRKFIPISQVMSEDLLVSETGESISLVDIDDDAERCDGSINSTPVAVYNLELYRKHTYFAGESHVLVHNGCSLMDYFMYLKDKGFVYPKDEKGAGSIYIEVPMNGVKEMAFDKKDQVSFSKVSRGVPYDISTRMSYLGFKKIRGRQGKEDFLWKLKHKHKSVISVQNYMESLQYFGSRHKLTGNFIEEAIAVRDDVQARSLYYKNSSIFQAQPELSAAKPPSSPPPAEPLSPPSVPSRSQSPFSAPEPPSLSEQRADLLLEMLLDEIIVDGLPV